MRKYDTLIHSPGYGQKSYDALAIADYSSKQSSGKRSRLSSTLSISTS